MSSAENGRLVFLDDALCGLIYTALAHSYPKDIAKADTFWQAWKAAPADSTEAIAKAIYEATVTSPEDGTDWAVEDDWIRDGYREHEAQSVLAALGVPQRPTPRNETPHG